MYWGIKTRNHSMIAWGHTVSNPQRGSNKEDSTTGSSNNQVLEVFMVVKIPSHNNNTKDRRDQMLISDSSSNRLPGNSKTATTRITGRVMEKSIGLSQRTTQAAEEVAVPKIFSGIFSEDSKKRREDKWKKKREWGKNKEGALRGATSLTRTEHRATIGSIDKAGPIPLLTTITQRSRIRMRKKTGKKSIGSHGRPSTINPGTQISMTL